ncbi:hypothetical protein B0J14DRAFT_687862 [Halenospora varia]|nr:hypothetical protein B0J14DRAFT_687862 [Halenospora varia]
MTEETSIIVVSPGSFSRPLGNLEVFFKTLADLGAPLQREHWAVHLALRLNFISGGNIEISDPEPYLRRAWQLVRRQHPAIGSTISPAAHASRERLNLAPFDADAWVNDTFVVHRDHGNADALFSNIRPSPTTMCYWLPSSSELVIRSSHWRLDGIGMLMLGHSFLTALAEILRLGPNEASRDAYIENLPVSAQPLPQNLEELASKGSGAGSDKNGIDSDMELRTGASADALVAEFLRGVPSIGLPTRPDSENIPPGASARSQVRLDAATTAKLTATRRAKGFSFTGAVHAAIVRVTVGFPQHPLSKAYAAFFPVDLRKYLAATDVVAEDELVFGLYFSGLPVCVDGMVSSDNETPASKSFEDVAREMTAVYGRDLAKFWTAPDGQVVSLLELAEPYLTRTTALFSTPVPEGLPPIQTPDLSGLGKVEAYLQREYESSPEAPKVEVADVWIATEMLNRSIQFHVWAWKDELSIGASFNQSFYEKSFVVEVLGKVVKELLTGLGIDE